jgi:hypothetical protein
MFKIIKQAKLQWLQDPSEINEDNRNNKRCDASRHFRNKRREYLNDKINELATNSKNKIRDLYRGTNKFKRAYQPKSTFFFYLVGWDLTPIRSLCRSPRFV